MTDTHVPTTPPSSCDARPLLTPTAAAARLGVTPRALAIRRRRGIGPRYIRLSPATIRYLSDDLEHDRWANILNDTAR